VFINYSIDVLNISNFQGRAHEKLARLFLTAQKLYPGYLRKAQRIMVGVPTEFQGRFGFENWFHFTPWRLVDTGCEKCKHVMFVFGGTEETKMSDLVDIADVLGVSVDEERSMAVVRESLERARDEGYCGGLEVGFARDGTKVLAYRENG
jgi:hypothetical protein